MPSYFSLAQLTTILQSNLLQASDLNADISVSGITTDTRTIRPNELFIALVGENFDGHNFVTQAVAKGAIAIIVDRQIESITVPQFIVKDISLTINWGTVIDSIWRSTIIAIAPLATA